MNLDRNYEMSAQPLLVNGERVVLTCNNPVCKKGNVALVAILAETRFETITCHSCGQWLFGMDEVQPC